MENLRRHALALFCWIEQLILVFVYMRCTGAWVILGILLCCISSYVKANGVCRSATHNRPSNEINEDGKQKSDIGSDGLEMGRAESMTIGTLEEREGEAAENNDRKASPIGKDDDDDDVEMLRALYEKEKQCLAGDLVELANVLTQNMRDCKRLMTEEHSCKLEEEKKGLIAMTKRLQKLYRDKERSHKQEVLLRNKERHVLSMKLMDANWGLENFRLLYKRSTEEKIQLVAQLEAAVSSSEYYQAYIYDVYETCHKLKEQNKVLSDKLCELADKCRWLEEDKQNLIGSLEAAEANTELLAQFIFLSPWIL